MFVLGEGGACSTRGARVRPSCRGRVRSARMRTGRCFLIVTILPSQGDTCSR